MVKFEDTDGSDGFTNNVDEGLAGFTFEVFVDGVSEGSVTTSNTGPGTPLGLATSTGVTADLGQFVVVCEEPEPGYAFDFPTFVNAEAGDPDGEGRPCFGFTITENQFNLEGVRISRWGLAVA